MSISGTFAAVGVSDTDGYGELPRHLDYVLSGTFVGSFQLERALTPDASAWVPVVGPLTAAAVGRVTTQPNDRLRWRCTAYTSGIASYSLVPDRLVRLNDSAIRDATVYLLEQEGLEVTSGTNDLNDLNNDLTREL